MLALPHVALLDAAYIRGYMYIYVALLDAAPPMCRAHALAPLPPSPSGLPLTPYTGCHYELPRISMPGKRESTTP